MFCPLLMFCPLHLRPRAAHKESTSIKPDHHPDPCRRARPCMCCISHLLHMLLNPVRVVQGVGRYRPARGVARTREGCLEASSAGGRSEVQPTLRARLRGADAGAWDGRDGAAGPVEVPHRGKLLLGEMCSHEFAEISGVPSSLCEDCENCVETSSCSRR